jgi:hypothetical protein
MVSNVRRRVLSCKLQACIIGRRGLVGLATFSKESIGATTPWPAHKMPASRAKDALRPATTIWKTVMAQVPVGYDEEGGSGFAQRRVALARL